MVPFIPSPEIVRQAQVRLARLGHDTSGDAPGVLGERTAIAIQAFQRQRGLLITGELDAVTWGRLVEAGWSLGDRLLYVDRPLQRGDDVAALQEALALLGFNPGRIDGIFGVLTEVALADFQRNCGLEPDGVLSRASLNELVRMSSRSPDRLLVTETRDAAIGLASDALRRVVVHGDGPLARSVVEGLSRVLEVIGAPDQSDHACAALANRQDAALVLSIEESLDAAGVAIHYFASYRSLSIIGERLAGAVAARAGRRGVAVDVSGMSVPILRETMMPALHIVCPPRRDGVEAVLRDALEREVESLFRQG